jgi:hypothetical protein
MIWLRSIAAVFVGLLAVFVLSTGTDQILHAWHFYPAWNLGMHDPVQNLVALGYRCVYAAVGGYIAAKFAPYKPMTHALVLGAIGLVLALLGFFATRTHDLAPAWYPLALVVTAIPCAWLGGVVQRKLAIRAIENRTPAR